MASLLLLAALAAPAVAGPAYSRPIPGDAAKVYRLAWVQPGCFLRSGAVVVGGDHLAGDAPEDRAAVQAAYADLKRRYGLGAVINLRAEAHEDEAAARQAGMMYLHLPIEDGAPPSPAQVAQFFEFLGAARAKNRVVLWHCAGGIGRTGVFAAMLRLKQGWSTEEAAREMFAMGLTYDQAHWHLPALNAFASALGKPGFYPADWPGPRRSAYDYRAVAGRLPVLR